MLTGLGMVISSPAQAGLRGCSDVIRFTGDVEEVVNLLDDEDSILDAATRRRIRSLGISLEQMGDFIAEDPEASKESQQLGVQLAASAVKLMRASKGEDRSALLSTLRETFDVLEALSDVCFLTEH
jgi:hypothetical protein